MGLADEIENGTFEGLGVTEEQLTELKLAIAEAGIPVIAFLTDHFAEDNDAPTVQELARMAATAKEVAEFLEGQMHEQLERLLVAEALGQMLVEALGGED